MAAEQIKGSGY